MNRRVAARRAGGRWPRRYSVEVYGPRSGRMRAAAFGGHTCRPIFVLVDLP